MDFSQFDKKVDMDQLKKDIIEAKENSPEYAEVPVGTYSCTVDKLEIGETKDGRPMLKAQFRIIGDEDCNKCDFTKQCLFMNRVLYGTKNDANMIASAVGWLESLDPSEEVGEIEFTGYQQFSDLVMDIEEDVQDLKYTVKYDPEAFNNISIIEVFE